MIAGIPGNHRCLRASDLKVGLLVVGEVEDAGSD
jgi:hypothetical protein